MVLQIEGGIAMTQAMVTRAEEGLTFTTTPTDVMTFLCEGDQQMPDVMVERLSPGDGPPLHSHPWAAWDVVVRGQVRFRIDGEDIDLGPGDFIHTPADAVHAFVATGDEQAEMVEFQFPGGFHVAYADLAAAFSDGTPDPSTLAQIAQKHNFTLHGPPLSIAGQNTALS